MPILPHVVRAIYEKDFRLRLTFNDGVQASVDFRPWLAGPVFEPLMKASYFRKFFLDGGTVVWPNGADIAPETLYDAATQSNPLQPMAARAIDSRRG